MPNKSPNKNILFPRRGTEESKAIIEWARDKIGNFCPLSTIAIAICEGQDIQAACLFDELSETNCNMHIASSGTRSWGNRRFAYTCFAYPFLTLKKKRITGRVRADNAQALRFDKHLGFVEEGRIREATPSGDLIILGMLARECRFIRPEFVHKIDKDLPTYLGE